MIDNELSANRQSPESRMDKVVAFGVPLLVLTFKFGQGAGSNIFFYHCIYCVPHNHSRIPAKIPNKDLSAFNFVLKTNSPSRPSQILEVEIEN
jgi:hypothetical protein